MRLLPAVVIMVAVCTATGCTTVSAPPPAAPDSAPARRAPDTVLLTPPPAQPQLATVQPDAADRDADAAAPAGAGRAPQRRPASAVPHPVHPAHPVRRSSPRTGEHQVNPVPADGGSGGAGGVCALGRDYGRWPAGSPAATICGQTYGN